MAIVHSSATIRPTKTELLTTVAGGPVEVVGSYRFDDPDGEVGVEGFVVRRGAQLQHVVFTYRSAPLDAGEAQLVSMMEHSELGPRWVYDGSTDPVAVDCFRRAMLGEQAQAVLELWEDGRMVGTRPPSVRLTVRAEDQADRQTVRILRTLGDTAPGPALVASWAGGEAVVATLGPSGSSPTTEAGSLLSVLERNRRTFAWKTSGLGEEGLRATTAASAMTLGGLVKHMALVEADWLAVKLAGQEYGPPWDTVDFDADPDWEWRTGALDAPDHVYALWRGAVERSCAIVTDVINERGLDGPASVSWPDGRTPTVRAMILDMIEEYARHTGHADILREAVDGRVGEGAPEEFTF
jgi:hypothetical protein